MAWWVQVAGQSSLPSKSGLAPSWLCAETVTSCLHLNSSSVQCGGKKSGCLLNSEAEITVKRKGVNTCLVQKEGGLTHYKRSVNTIIIQQRFPFSRHLTSPMFHSPLYMETFYTEKTLHSLNYKILGGNFYQISSFEKLSILVKNENGKNNFFNRSSRS